MLSEEKDKLVPENWRDREKKYQRIIPKPHTYLHSIRKTSAKFQNNRRKTVRGAAPTRYLLSLHFDSISYRKKRLSSQSRKSEKNNQSIIPKPHAHLQFMLKTSAKFPNNQTKTVRGVVPKRYPLSILICDQFWSSTSFGHICFKTFIA